MAQKQKAMTKKKYPRNRINGTSAGRGSTNTAATTRMTTMTNGHVEETEKGNETIGYIVRGPRAATNAQQGSYPGRHANT